MVTRFGAIVIGASYDNRTFRIFSRVIIGLAIRRPSNGDSDFKFHFSTENQLQGIIVKFISTQAPIR